MENKQESNDKVATIKAEIEKAGIECQKQLLDVVAQLDYWGGLLSIDTVRGVLYQIQIRSANHQRGGGGKRTQYKHDGVVYESGQALCDKLGIAVEGDSAVRKLERYVKHHPDVDIEIVD